jgi:arsenical-resistance protein 2
MCPFRSADPFARRDSRFPHFSIPEVIFHCSSSKGRGPRCAAWYQDELNDKGSVTSQAFVLTGGINAWVTRYPEEVVRA